MIVVAWTRTLTGEHGYVRRLGLNTIQMCDDVKDAVQMTDEEADDVIARLNGCVGTYAYKIGLSDAS